MRRGWPYLKTLYWAAVGVLLGVILHISYVLAAPHLSTVTAWRQLSPLLPINELIALARDGKSTTVSYNAQTFHDRDRRLQGVFAAARDMTELKRYEQTLHHKIVATELFKE